MSRNNNIIPNGAPTFQDQGIEDRSGANVVAPTPITPSLCPLVFLTTAQGPEDPILISNIEEFNRIYGEETFNTKGKYWDHANFMSYMLMSKANKHIIQRIVPDDAKHAYLRISLEIIPDSNIPNYERNPDNSVVLNAGSPVVDSTTPTITGNRINIMVSEIADPDDLATGFGVASKSTGTIDVGDGMGEIFPLFDIKTTFKSELSNNIGFSIAANNIKNDDGFSTQDIEAGGGYPYKLAFYKKDVTDSTIVSRITAASTGAAAVNFSLNSTEISNLGIEKGLKQIYDAAYTDYFSDNIQTTGQRIYGPTDDIHMYDSSILEAATMLHDVENPLNEFGTRENVFSINLLGEYDFEGNLYHSIRLIDTLDAVPDSIIPSEETINYMRGGSDGDISYATRMANLESFMLEFGDNLVLLDKERNPWTAIVDSGYPMNIKEEFIKTHAYSEDHIVYLSDQDIMMEPNTPEQTLATAEYLTSKISLYNESPVFSTDAARFVIAPYMGIPLGELGFQSKEPTVCLFDLISKLSDYMGNGTGGWNDTFDPSLEVNKTVDTIRITNFVTLPKTFRDNQAKAQLISIETYGLNSMIYTDYQTAYPNDTSVLNTITAIQASVEALRIGRKIHKVLAGTDNLTDGQLIKLSDERISEYFQNKSPSKISVIPETTFTDYDNEVGNKWTTNVTVRANVSRKNNTFKVITERNN